MPLHVFFDKNIQKEAFLGAQEAKKEEDFCPHIPAPDQFVLICKKIHEDWVKINKNESPKALASSKTAAPFDFLLDFG